MKQSTGNDKACLRKRRTYERNVLSVLRQAGFIRNEKITDTLQGQTWRSIQRGSGASDREFVIKVTSKKLHNHSAAKLNGRAYAVHENILREKEIMQYLSTQDQCPSAIIKFHHFFESNSNYYLVMEHGGYPLFEFILKAHRLIKCHKIAVSEWHTLVKTIFKQMVTAVEFMHQHNAAHFDISLENTLINDIPISVQNPGETSETISFDGDIKIKIIDLGLAQQFDPRDNFKSNKYCGKSNYQSPEITYQQNSFNAAANDIWCLGVTLFMMLAGSAPFYRAHHSDRSYQCIMNGQIESLLEEWNLISLFTHDALDLISSMLQLENTRVSIQQIKEHRWLN